MITSEEPQRGRLAERKTDWAGLKTTIAGLDCCWVGLDGLHVGDPPGEDSPIGATHLWAWKERTWVRARLDGSDAYVSELVADDEGLGTFLVENGLRWSNDEARLGSVGRDSMSVFSNRDVTVLTLLDASPVTFMEVHGV